MVYVDDFFFWAHSKSNIEKVMKSFKYDGTTYNWEYSKRESVPGLLGIDIRKLDNGGFEFHQTELIRKVLEATCMKNLNGFPTPTKDEANLGID